MYLRPRIVSPMSKKALILTGFFVVLVLGFYFTLTKVIPGYGEKRFQVLNYVKPFSFINQDGRRVDQSDLKGKVYVAEYFFTTCKSICPIMNKNMLQIYQQYKDDPGFVILSHTVDPETDSVGRLKYYADSLKVNTARWWFLTGSKDSLYDAARSSYLLDDPKNNSENIEEQFLHTQFFALVVRTAPGYASGYQLYLTGSVLKSCLFLSRCSCRKGTNY